LCTRCGWLADSNVRRFLQRPDVLRSLGPALSPKHPPNPGRAPAPNPSPTPTQSRLTPFPPTQLSAMHAHTLSYAHAPTRSRSPQTTSTSQAQHPLALSTSRRAPRHWRFAVPHCRPHAHALRRHGRRHCLGGFFRDLCPLVQRAPRSKCRGWRGAAIRANTHCMQVQSKRVVGLADQVVLALSQSARAEQPAVPPARTPAVPAVPEVARR
jgi:hypothetical protein